MSFAAEMPNEKNSSFFVMPLPSYWKKAGVTDSVLGPGNLVTGVFIHEFSHSQQMQNFGKQITVFEKQSDFNAAFNDDIVQSLFANDSAYLDLYRVEVEKFYAAASRDPVDQSALQVALKIMNKRQNAFFKGQYESLKQIDNFFLTMEGLGQYSMFLWLTHPQGANVERGRALEAVRRSKKWWSQDEGFALFLLLDRLARPDTWAKEFFGDKTESVISLIHKMQKEKSSTN
jgi:hypothetical protein